MAVEPQKPKSRKKQQIEPLDWSTMSQSPALKGMVSPRRRQAVSIEEMNEATDAGSGATGTERVPKAA